MPELEYAWAELLASARLDACPNAVVAGRRERYKRAFCIFARVNSSSRPFSITPNDTARVSKFLIARGHTADVDCGYQIVLVSWYLGHIHSAEVLHLRPRVHTTPNSLHEKTFTKGVGQREGGRVRAVPPFYWRGP